MISRFILCFLLSVFGSSPLLLYGKDSSDEYSAIWLTWEADPLTSMTISWLAPVVKKPLSVKVYYRPYDTDASKHSWSETVGLVLPLPEDASESCGSVLIESLEPNTEYEFRIGQQKNIWRFLTAPSRLEKPLVFAVGGDTISDDPQLFERTNRRVAECQPLFVALGGDLAYAAPMKKSKKEHFYRWQNWLSIWFSTMRIDGNRLIPLLVTIGNHEVKGQYGETPEEAPLYYALFRMPGPQGYSVLRFNTYLSFYFLDSGHTHPIEGAQTRWLEEQLILDTDIPNKIALYHVPAYPCVRYMKNEWSTKVRRYWVPLFEKYHLQYAFENHDHAYKRTFPLIQGNIDPDGVIYVGDGSWGVKARIPTRASKSPYFAITKGVSQFCVVTLSDEDRTISAITPEGRIIDSVFQNIPRGITHSNRE